MLEPRSQVTKWPVDTRPLLAGIRHHPTAHDKDEEVDVDGDQDDDNDDCENVQGYATTQPLW